MARTVRSKYSEINSKIKEAEQALLPGLAEGTAGTVDPAAALSRAQAYESVLMQFGALNFKKRFKLLTQEKLVQPLDHALYWYYIAQENGYIVKDKLQQLMQLGFALEAYAHQNFYQRMQQGLQDLTLNLSGRKPLSLNTEAYLAWFFAAMNDSTADSSSHFAWQKPAGSHLRILTRCGLQTGETPGIISDEPPTAEDTPYITPLFSYLLARQLKEPGSLGPLADKYLHLGLMEKCAEHNLQGHEADYECLFNLPLPADLDSLPDLVSSEYTFMTSLCEDYVEYAAQILSQHYLARFVHHAFIPGMPAQASFMIGMSYLYGSGLPCDRDAARSWLAYASSLGHPAAQYALLLFFKPLHAGMQGMAENQAAEYAVVCARALDNFLQIMAACDCSACSIDFYDKAGSSWFYSLLYNALSARLQQQSLSALELPEAYLDEDSLWHEAARVLEQENIELSANELSALLSLIGVILLHSDGEAMPVLHFLCMTLALRAGECGIAVENPQFGIFLQQKGLQQELSLSQRNILHYAGCYLEAGLSCGSIPAVECALSCLTAGKPVCLDEDRLIIAAAKLAAAGHGLAASALYELQPQQMQPEQLGLLIRQAAAMDSPQAALIALRQREFKLQDHERLELARMVYDSGGSGGCAELALALAAAEPQTAKTLAELAQFQGSSQRCRKLIDDHTVQPLPFMQLILQHERLAQRGDQQACRFMAALYFTGCVLPASYGMCSYYLQLAARSGRAEDLQISWAVSDKPQQLLADSKTFQARAGTSLSALQRRLRPLEFGTAFRNQMYESVGLLMEALDGESWLEQELFYQMLTQSLAEQQPEQLSMFVAQEGSEFFLITDRGRRRLVTPLFYIHQLQAVVDSPACTLTTADCLPGRQVHLETLQQALVLKKSRHPLYNLSLAQLALRPLLHRPDLKLARQYLLRAINGGQGLAALYFYSNWDLVSGTDFPESSAEAYSARHDFVTFTALSTGIA